MSMSEIVTRSMYIVFLLTVTTISSGKSAEMPSELQGVWRETDEGTRRCSASNFGRENGGVASLRIRRTDIHYYDCDSSECSLSCTRSNVSKTVSGAYLVAVTCTTGGFHGGQRSREKWLFRPVEIETSGPAILWSTRDNVRILFRCQ